MTTKTTKDLATAPKRTVKKAKLTAGIELSDSPVLSADELQTQIRRRAYELFLQRNPEAGSAETDWLQAEYEVTTALNKVTTAPTKKAKAPRTVRARSSPPSSSATQTPTRTRRKQPPASPKS
jgi:hypothetical protein